MISRELEILCKVVRLDRLDDAGDKPHQSSGTASRFDSLRLEKQVSIINLTPSPRLVKVILIVSKLIRITQALELRMWMQMVASWPILGLFY